VQKSIEIDYKFLEEYRKFFVINNGNFCESQKYVWIWLIDDKYYFLSCNSEKGILSTNVSNFEKIRNEKYVLLNDEILNLILSSKNSEKVSIVVKNGLKEGWIGKNMIFTVPDFAINQEMKYFLSLDYRKSQTMNCKKKESKIHPILKDLGYLELNVSSIENSYKISIELKDEVINYFYQMIEKESKNKNASKK